MLECISAHMQVLLFKWICEISNFLKCISILRPQWRHENSLGPSFNPTELTLAPPTRSKNRPAKMDSSTQRSRDSPVTFWAVKNGHICSRGFFCICIYSVYMLLNTLMTLGFSLGEIKLMTTMHCIFPSHLTVVFLDMLNWVNSSGCLNDFFFFFAFDQWINFLNFRWIEHYQYD